MDTQAEVDYNRIAKSIAYFKSNFKLQPTLEQAAEHVHLSPFHFQRMFKNWVGVTPKQFLQYLSIEHAKAMLYSDGNSLANAAYSTGLSGTSRLHDLFIKVEGMTPGEYKSGGEMLEINYSFAETPFGTILVASTKKGICYLAFSDSDGLEAFHLLQAKFPNAVYNHFPDKIQQDAVVIFSQDWSKLSEIKLHLKGTPFQLKVWEALLTVPMGRLTTYGTIAKQLNNPNASRAVGTAVGDNPVAFLIPCHRVIKSTGETGQYHWGSDRKSAIIGWEAANCPNNIR